MRMIRWDPFQELETISSRLNQYLNRPPARIDDRDAVFADWTPVVDVEETDREYVMKADLPGVEKDEVKVGIEDGVLSVEGERNREKEEKTSKFHRVERMHGKFVRRLAIPTDVDQQKVAAEFKNGVLCVHLPKSAAAPKPRNIDVKVA